MAIQDELTHHSQRARRELHLGLTAQSIPDARAHLGLSSLHMKKVVEIEGPGRRSRPLCIVD
ncbi:MAG TPA: hypothetical protein VF759_06720 [Allosphingosinicella sp.]|jgi:hypothetical protein